MRFLLPVGAIAAFSLAISARGDDPSGPPAKAEPPKSVSVKNQLHARYLAGAQEDERDGPGISDNHPKRLADGDTFGKAGELSIVAFPDEEHQMGKYRTIPLRIVNRSNEREFFSAIDSHLFIVQEAKDEKGDWKPIERIPHGTGPRDCATGFHRISLKPGQYWNLTGLQYSGPLKTKLRFRVDLGRNDKKYPSPGGKILYSNEFEGSIHPEQFTRPGGTGGDLNSSQ